MSRIDNGLDSAHVLLKQYLKNIGDDIIVEQFTILDTRTAIINCIPLIMRIIQLHKKYSILVTKCFGDHKLFVQSIDEVYIIFLYFYPFFFHSIFRPLFIL